MKIIKIVGIGMGNPDTLTLEGKRAIEESHVVIGARRMVDSVCRNRKEQGAGKAQSQAQGLQHRVYSIVPEEIRDYIDSCSDAYRFAVVMSGDVGFFSGTKKLIPLLEEKYQVDLIPGINSLSYFCARLHMSWEEVKIVSLHGKQANFVGEIQTCEKTFLLTDREQTPAQICRILTENGLGAAKIFIGERLSYEDEKITCGTAEELQHGSFDTLSVVLVQNPQTVRSVVTTHGIEDAAFVRGKVPMTKSEVRSITLSKLQLAKDDIVYDIGAGTGSVSIEMALQASKGQVYAVECSEEGLSLIRENRSRFGAVNLHPVAGMAPDVLDDLPSPDKVFIGGSKGNLEAIVKAVSEKNPLVRIVMNVIALESLMDSLNAVQRCGLELIDVVQISVARGKELGNYHLMMGQNPVFILTAQKADAGNE